MMAEGSEPGLIRLFLFCILLAFMILPVQAQKKGYAPGYIITPEGEITEGQVKDRSSGTFMDLYKRIRFKPDDRCFRRKYSPDEILGYGYDDLHFESVPLREESAFFRFRYYLHESNDRIFLKVISSDKDLTYFQWEYVDDESSYLDYIPLFYRDGSDEMVRVTQGILGLKRNRLMEYFRDCPELVRAIESKELNEIDEVYYLYLERCSRETQ
jgi:hypothetical protein